MQTARAGGPFATREESREDFILPAAWGSEVNILIMLDTPGLDPLFPQITHFLVKNL
jgi:hypothetical protein